MLQKACLVLSLLLVLVRCGTPQKNSELFETGRVMGINKNHSLEEASGLVASSRNPGLLWTHNDSGNPATLFLLDSTAATRKVFSLLKVKNRDWEDIARGPGPEENTSYLYIGDIGDNNSNHDVKYIYRIKEPSLDDPKEISQVDTLVVKLEDGARDSEALLCDPVSKNLYIVSKREKNVRLYEITSPFQSDTLIGKRIFKFPFNYITGGDISPDGKEVLLKNYEKIFYWKKTGNETLVELLRQPPVELAYQREPQGEGIGWSIDGSGFYTMSENAKGERARLYYYKRKK